MQDNSDWQENFPRDRIVAQNLKAPERSQESKIAANNTDQGNYSKDISDAEKQKIQARNKTNSLGSALQICTQTKTKQYF